MGTVNWGFIRVSSSRRFTPLEKMNFISTSAFLLAMLTHQKSSAGELLLGVRRFPKDFAKNSILQIILESYIDDFFGGPKRTKAGIKIDRQRAEKLFD